MGMKIAEVAARSGVPASTLRFYESIGLLTPHRADNGYRSFDPGDLDRLDFIASAKRLGLELPEIRSLLQLADTGTCTAVRQALLPRLAEQITAAERQLAALAELRDHLVRAYDHVHQCPDSPDPCMSECAFRTFAQAPTPARS